MIPDYNFTVSKRDRFRFYERQRLFFCFNLVFVLTALIWFCSYVDFSIYSILYYIMVSPIIGVTVFAALLLIICIFFNNRIFNMIIAILYAISYTILAIIYGCYVYIYLNSSNGFYNSVINDLSKIIYNSNLYNFTSHELISVQATATLSWIIATIVFISMWIYSFLAIAACFPSKIADVSYSNNITIEIPSYLEIKTFIKDYYKPSFLTDEVDDEERIKFDEINWEDDLSVLKFNDEVRGYSLADSINNSIVCIFMTREDKWNSFYEEILVQDSIRRLTGNKSWKNPLTLNNNKYHNLFPSITKFGWKVINSDQDHTTFEFTPRLIEYK